MSTLPDSPMLLDSTGQAMLTKLQGIIEAINNSGGGGGSSTLAGLNDVAIASPSNGQVLSFDSNTNKWKNVTGGGGSTPLFLMPENYKDHIDPPDPEYPEEYVSGYLYVVGEYCYYNGNAYKCNTEVWYDSDHGPVEFDPHYWDLIDNVFSEILLKPGKREKREYSQSTYGSESFNNTSVPSYSAGSHAEGCATEASGENSHAEGENTEANGNDSHAEGYYAKARAAYSHAEGYLSESTGQYSHAEGNSSISSGTCSHSGGSGSKAKGASSFAHGVGVNSENAYEVSFGKHNVSKSSRSDVSEYDPNASYYISGQLVKHDNDGHIYSCKQTIMRPGEWDPTKWNDTGETYENDPNKITAFTIGNGTSASDRHNLLELSANGALYLNGVPAIAVTPPSTDGTYTLKCTVVDGVPTYSWVADT